MKKISTGICILVFLVGLTACSQEETVQESKTRPIRSMVIESPEALEAGSLAGQARAAQSVDLSFRVNGPLIERPVSVGDIIQKGDVVAKIDPSDFETEVRRTTGMLDQAQAALARASGDFRREMNIFKEDSGATSEAAIDRKKEGLSRAQANVKSAEAALQTAKNQLAYSELTSPIGGRVVGTYVENFETVQAKQRIVRVLDNTRIKFDVDVPEQNISQAPFVTDVFVNFDAFPGVDIPAQIAEIATESSKTTRTYRVTLILEQPENMEILAGMAGNARFTLERQKEDGVQVYTVPNSSIFSSVSGDATYVWVVNPETMVVEKREIEVARVSEFGTEIGSGLTAGETIATAGVHFLQEGTKVHILVAQPDAQ